MSGVYKHMIFRFALMLLIFLLCWTGFEFFRFPSSYIWALMITFLSWSVVRKII